MVGTASHKIKHDEIMNSCCSVVDARTTRRHAHAQHARTTRTHARPRTHTHAHAHKVVQARGIGGGRNWQLTGSDVDGDCFNVCVFVQRGGTVTHEGSGNHHLRGQLS